VINQKLTNNKRVFHKIKQTRKLLELWNSVYERKLCITCIHCFVCSLKDDKETGNHIISIDCPHWVADDLLKLEKFLKRKLDK